MDIEAIKKRIQALLNKTENRGATEDESAAAIAKASELMKKYNIAEADLGGELDQGIIMESLKTKLSQPIVTLFGGQLAKLFDCSAFGNSGEVEFVGLYDDAKLAAFLFKILENTCEQNLKEFKKTEDYIIKVKLGGNGAGRSMCNSFRKGFFKRIGQRLLVMYNERQQQRRNESNFALVLANKDKRIQDYIDKTINVRTYTPSPSQLDEDAYTKGFAKAGEVSIQQGINNK